MEVQVGDPMGAGARAASTSLPQNSASTTSYSLRGLQQTTQNRTDMAALIGREM
eukprot:CAMPEP_0177393306 /NCGR_PEP_ID=MMETSP0368-20130122/54879_1 /TAXON_ID=447022 ORGANISM="Scrippsiella hangoei-like, Strain SHHI-4" /NCGR_SAMPLE_ID=MMETSP0368 /ASSEMBLY_ACC=CAM_ASM_000363 /LENGTH=53 /DNA_ID=CAMNT_0018859477 /DNA_START=64 /DNA_END=221 /DNA_ORIENTATION=-